MFSEKFIRNSLRLSSQVWPKALAATCLSMATLVGHAALLAYEPFTNSPGAALIGSAAGFGFSGGWQANSSAGVATNTSYPLSYTDAGNHALATAGGAGFFQGLTTANTSMQPIRPFGFSRGTNGVDGGTTWISFLIARQGPTGTLAGNLYGRGANVPHDLGTLQKLAIGNSSAAASNTVGLIPTGAAGNLKGATNTFGGTTNFVVVRIDHTAGAANDNAYLFVNPPLDAEPALGSAGANSLNAFDFSFNQLRIFAGGQNSAAQPYAEIVVDEYRIGETFADVAPIASNTPPVVVGPLVITNTFLISDRVVLTGRGGSNAAPYLLLTTTNVAAALTNWLPVATNHFDAAGNFATTNPSAPGLPQQFFRVLYGDVQLPPPVPPTITLQPTNQTAPAGGNISLLAAATGSEPLHYQWRFNNVAIPSATNATLTMFDVQFAMQGGYSLRVSNVAGAITSELATITIQAPPAIVTQPTNLAVVVGSSATFLVGANGSPSLRYQWYFNTNTALLNATNAVYFLAGTQTNQAGSYAVVVTNDFGAVTSAVVTLTVNAAPTLLPGAYFVSPAGNDLNPGTLASPFLTITKGLNTITTSGTLYLRGGTYAQPSKLSLNRIGITNGAIRFWAYPGETPVINSSGNSSDGLSISGQKYHLKGLTVTLAGHNGINISGHSNVIENCVTFSNGNTGLHLTGSAAPGPTGNLILNCDSYLNFDPSPDGIKESGGNADGFSAKWDIGPGNVFRGCRAWWNSDDGWDLWMGTSSVVIDQCWVFYNGTNYWNDPLFNGNGQGFKLGGNYIGTPHRLLRSVAFRNESNGVDQNNNEEGQTLDNNTSWANKARNYSMNHGTNSTPHIMRNNLSFAGGSLDAFRSGTVYTNNSWDVISPAPSSSDVISIDESIARAPRNADGSLPYWPFLRPVSGGRLIDKGVILTEPYTGAAPDLGAFEDGL